MNTKFNNQGYSHVYSVWKALKPLLLLLIGGESVLLALEESLPATIAEHKWMVMVLAMVIFGIKYVDNYNENRTQGPSPKWTKLQPILRPVKFVLDRVTGRENFCFPFVFCLLIPLFTVGCTHINQQASYEPVINADGNVVVVYDKLGNVVGIAASKTLTQKVGVSAGGKLKEGMLDFAADAVSSDESGWSVTAGSQSAGHESPDTVKSVTGLVKELGSQYMGLQGIKVTQEAQVDMAEIASRDALIGRIAEIINSGGGIQDIAGLLGGGSPLLPVK